MARRVFLAGVAVGIVLLSGCTFARRSSLPEPTPTPVSTPTPEASDERTAPTLAPRRTAAAAERPSLFVVRLVDPGGMHSPGIPVAVEGPWSGTLLSDERGEIHLTEPGWYAVRVPAGCHDQVLVLRGSSGRAGAALGDQGSATLEVDWKLRFGPSPPVFASFTGGWPVGKPTEVRYNVIDRCTKEYAPSTAYPRYEFVPSPNLSIEGIPVLASDGDGHGRIVVRCLAVGEVKLEVRDTLNPSDSFDLVAETFDLGGRPRCVNA